jgi:hypothetical protein
MLIQLGKEITHHLECYKFKTEKDVETTGKTVEGIG